MHILRAIVIAILFLGTDVRVQAQTFPDRAIKITVPYPAGGPSDTVARVATQGLGGELGQAVIVENTAGAGGKVGTKAVTRRRQTATPC
jgi:tripartite-type tricarboxylate transporter receptor subunit TctC